MTTAHQDNIDRGDELTLHSGNISGVAKVTKRATQSTANELLSGIEGAVDSWVGSPVEERTNNGITLIQHKSLANSISSSDRQDLLITIKVFVMQWSEQLVRDALSCALHQLGLHDCDMLILAMPSNDFTVEKAKKLWMEVAQLSTNRKASIVGVADLSKDQLEQLYDCAQVKPTINQVNLASCCVMPEDLVEYAKKANVTLYTHNDDPDIVTSETITPIITKLPGTQSTCWQPLWAVRYSTQVKCRGILGRRGYFVHVKRCAV